MNKLKEGLLELASVQGGEGANELLFSFMETLFYMSVGINDVCKKGRTFDKEKLDLSNPIIAAWNEQGFVALTDLAIKWTEEFEECHKNADTFWDGQFYEEVERFIECKCKGIDYEPLYDEQKEEDKLEDAIENPYYVDIPTSNCVNNPEGAFENVAKFKTKEEALIFAKEHFGADENGNVNLITH